MDNDRDSNDRNKQKSPAASAAGLPVLPSGLRTPPKNPLAHFYWSEAIERMAAAILDRPDAAIIALIGPSGVGKTAAAAAVVHRVIDERLHDFMDPGMVPFGFCEARSSEDRRRTWSTTVNLLLGSLHEPLIRQKIIPDEHPVKVKNKDDQAALHLEACCRNRKTCLLIIDEFHHLLRGTKKEAQHRKLELLKSLSNNTGTKTMIIGTTDILEALDCNGETGRRAVVVPFPRYRLVKSDLKDFREVLEMVEQSLGAQLEVKLSRELAYAWDATVGCVGLLATWIAGAQSSAKRSNSRITKQILDDEIAAASTRDKMDAEARACEAYVERNHLLQEARLARINAQIDEELRG